MVDVEQLNEAINNTFMWSFKKGDNIIYNFQILDALYESRKNIVGKSQLFNKPIILILVSIIECMIEDFTKRAKQRTHDPLPNLTNSQLLDYKTKKYDKLEHFISVAKKHNLFDRDNSFYDGLDKLRVIRNRFHIQANNDKLEADENKVFTNNTVLVAQRILEIIIEKMMTKFPRQPSTINFSDIIFPWSWYEL
jgi:hypothetical protein